MSETMVERVARAIYGVDRAPWDPEDFGRLDAGIQAATFRVARAAIEAMREPTPPVLKALRDTVPIDGHEWDYIDDEAAKCWRAMIDAALSETEGG